MEENRKALYDLVYLTGCGISGRIPSPERLAEMDLAEVYAKSCFHSLTAVTGAALESAGVIQGEPVQKWLSARHRSARKNLLLDAERMRLEAFLEAQGIRYLPLKGILLQELYPKAGMRQMSDNDILIDPAGREAVHDWFLSAGYQAVSYGEEYHDVYQKPPVCHFEIHLSLFSDSAKNSAFFAYYKDVLHRLKTEPGRPHCCRFSDADLYLYITAHTYKHYRSGGSGLRSVLDTYLCLSRMKIDLAYVQAEAKKLRISAFEQDLRRLSEKLFADPEAFSPEALTAPEREMLDFILDSGTYGTAKGVVQNRLARLEERTGSASRWRYLLRRLIPDAETLRRSYPFFDRHRWLMPLCFLYRLLRMVTVKRKEVLRELKILLK